jgi:hypothetical protein
MTTKGLHQIDISLAAGTNEGAMSKLTVVADLEVLMSSIEGVEVPDSAQIRHGTPSAQSVLVVNDNNCLRLNDKSERL